MPEQKKQPVEKEPWVPPEGSWASSAGRRRNMQAIRNRDTKPERLVRSLLHAQGLRYRVAAKPLPGLGAAGSIRGQGCGWAGGEHGGVMKGGAAP
ncbi:hypothetical protein ACFWIO_09425, partial [Streptomyces diastatochromogenes]